jgi:hypothetical protein
MYVGGTSRNRPKPDLVVDCTGGNPRVVAPCGYVPATLVIADLHGALSLGGVRATAVLVWGHLGNADVVSARNDRLADAASVPRTPVSDQALVTWGEVGWDAAPSLGLGLAHRLEPFVRLEHYDTMFRPRDDLFDNPRFSRTVASLGVSYQFHGGVFAKVDASHRRFGSSTLRPENGASVAGGFVF